MHILIVYLADYLIANDGIVIYIRYIKPAMSSQTVGVMTFDVQTSAIASHS